MDINALKTEINSDPESLGYAGETGHKVAELLNEVGLSNETVLRGAVPVEEILSNIVYAELNALTTKQLQILALYTSNGDLDVDNSLIQDIFKGLFGDGTATRANLLTLAQRACSRAEKLGLPIVKYWDVNQARDL